MSSRTGGRGRVGGLAVFMLEVLHAQDDEADAEEKEHVGDVEDPGEEVGAAVGPMQAEGDVNIGEDIQEVADSGEDEAVDEVAERAGENAPDGDMGERIFGAGAVGEDVDTDDDGDDGEGDEEPALTGADAEDSAAIEDEVEIEKTWDDGFRGGEGEDIIDVAAKGLDIHGLRADVGEGELLGDQVESEGAEEHGEESDPGADGEARAQRGG